MFERNKFLSVAVCMCMVLGISAGNFTRVSAEKANADGTYASQNNGAAANELKVVLNKKCKANTEIEFEASVSCDGDYELELVYKAEGRQNPVIEFTLDGKQMFAESERVEFSNNWVNGDKIRTDERGNEIAAEQILSEDAVKCTAINRTGMYEDPYTVSLEKGTHKVKMRVVQGEFELLEVLFKAPEQVSNYGEWLKERSVDTKCDKTVIIEGEAATLKSDKALIPLSDSASADVTPSNPIISKLNYIGGSNWSTVGESLTWEFECEKSGYYSLGFNYRQDTVINGVSYRHLRIDGETPFEEARRMKFKYGSDWQYFEYFDSDEPYLLYLEKGKHTLSLTVTAGELSEVYSGLSSVVADLGELYVDITMIVGETVDNYRSYELFNQIPNFNERLDENIKALNSLTETIETIQGESNGSLVSNIIGAIEILEQMRDNPYSAHRYKSSYYTSYTNLSATLGTLTDMPLDIDRIYLIGNGSSQLKTEASFSESVMFSLKRFFKTFTSDYTENDGDENGITLWVNWGRDQAQVLKALIREDFTANTGINVTVKVTNASIIQGILAGKGPDVMLNMSRTEPVNLAMRGALVDLSEFEDYGEVIKRFNSGATVPYEYKEGAYALPDTQNFYMLFARTDILEESGLEIPKTWDEFFRAVTVLQRSNLQASLPYTQITASTTVNVGVGGLTLYPTMLLQNGLSLYNNDLSASTLTESAQLKVFSDWCEWYTKYKIPTVMDFYNRFRIGSAPLGISNYTLITQLKATAPEIDGKWTVAVLPGTVREDGSVDYTSAGSGSGCAITKLSENPELAWEFLKWWTSADTQVKYSSNLESYIGPLGRVATSNLEAFDEIGWDGELLPAIKDQLAHTKETEEIPGGYYTARGIDQAFWNVVEQSRRPKDMLIEWGDIVNKEIARKQAEYAD